MAQNVVEIEVGRLVGHPRNSNAMGREALKKLMGHIRRSGRYPPLVVRRIEGIKGLRDQGTEGEKRYQVLDGHQRLKVLKQLGRKTAECVVWEGVDDEAALVLLATLNRLRGTEDPRKRGLLVQELQAKVGAEELGRLLPEGAGEIQRLLELAQPPPEVVRPRRLEDWPVAVHFFLVEEDRRKLERVLKALGGTREEALMGMVGRVAGTEGLRD